MNAPLRLRTRLGQAMHLLARDREQAMNLDDITKDVVRGIASVSASHHAPLPQEAVPAVYLRTRAMLRDASASARSADLAGELALAAFLELVAAGSELPSNVLPELRERIASTLAASDHEAATTSGDRR